ncbi:DNA methyltransferase [Mycobacterium phage Gompeii16]|uniref:DNA methyltransferase n=1 Tax=Mycobacterium phage Gompeii16 TaxID=1873895 RepID=UPI00081113F6|nr:DNA methyltransferase [Mycobacterium phage Gompeii16]ANU79475.1 DNA methylase [Mycobacterium phage Gompeii16]ANU79564.1 DNA methylase [Mycobacterium phage Bircsak]
MRNVDLRLGDCRDILTELEDASVDSIVTDPPYELGFMGKKWDGSGIAFDVEMWEQCLRVLKPGGHLLAFGGSRTWHRLTVAIEDAGFEIRDSIAWLYGSGFPKSLDVSKAIDKRPGVGRHAEFATELKAARRTAGYTNSFDVAEKVTGRRTGAVANWEKYQWPEARWWPALRDLLGMDAKWDGVIAEAQREVVGTRQHGRNSLMGGLEGRGTLAESLLTEASTDAAKQWQGWGTALKPAFEPIVVARKPLSGTVAANVLEHGTGALNIDACRIATDEDRSRPPRAANAIYGGGNGTNSTASESNPAGRWPTNVVLDEAQAAELDAQTGITISRKGKPRTGANGHGWGMTATGAEYDDEGGASRFFPVFKYQAKAPTKERPSYVNEDGTKVAHSTVKPLTLMRWLARLVCPPGGVILDPFAGSGTTVEACLLEGFDCIAIENEPDYIPLIEHRISRSTT